MDDNPPGTANLQNGNSEPHVLLATAKFAFNGKNNDELTFAKNDVIMVTQQMDGGWWEGTLNGHTGWFPSNYVVVVTEKEKLNRSRSVPNTDTIDHGVQLPSALENIVPSNSTRSKFREEVLKELMKNEEEYLHSLRQTVEDYLKPLRKERIMSDKDYDTLCGNIEQILHFQTDVMDKLKFTLEEEVPKQRVGGVLIFAAPALREMLLQYCENHPPAVEVMNEKEEELDNFVKDINGDKKIFVKGLSEPFRHLDKYPTALQELERNMPESHMDRGDVQRCCVVYKDMKYACDAVRKQKEMQLEFLAASRVDDWARFDERGRIKHLGLVAVERGGAGDAEEAEPETRFVVLFEKLMLILEVTAEQNAYKLSEKWRLDGQKVRKLEGRNAIAFSSDVPIVLAMSLQFDVERWLAAFAQCRGVTVDEVSTSYQPSPALKYDMNNVASLSPPRQPEVSDLPTAERARLGKKASYGPNEFKFNHELEMVVPEGEGPDENDAHRTHNAYTGACLRPYPPVRGPAFAVDYGKKPVKMRNKDVNVQSNEDAILLRIIEGYWQGGKGVPTTFEQAPQLIVAEDEKLLVEEIVGGEVVFQEKSLVDTVYALKDQVNSLQQKMEQLLGTVEKEQRMRRRLEDMWRRNSGQLNLSNITSTPRADTSASAESANV